MSAAGTAIEPDALARDTAALVAMPSLTGSERAVLERLGELAARLGLDAELREHDLAALRAHPDHPGEEAERHELFGLTVTLPGSPDGLRLALDGHLDVVAPGTEQWRLGPWSGAVEGGHVHGRGAVDMKGAVVAALHAMAAARGRNRGEVVLHAVSSEEDGGLGTFAALERDSRFDACLIPEPTGFDVVCAHAGALTFTGEVRGRAAHAAMRLEGESAIDAYVGVHAALAGHERAVNAEVEHPLMRELELPYPLSVGRIEGGEWSSSVPDRVSFEGRLGVRVGETLDEAADGLRAALAGHPVELSFTGARFESGQTPPDHPFTVLVRTAASAEAGREVAVAGVSYGADMRLFCARGIPCVMCGTPGLELAHAVDERVAVADLARLGRTIVAVIEGFGA
ncbi:MAG TPA: M20/M25/M40 family metallo-hydrolase [Thermoleophilaceae bacterium]|nr:M20/M25/M40 family metallo-hydrolase [Thermoleophilaceae bacterium]